MKNYVKKVTACYDKLATDYKLLYENWNESIERHTKVITSIFNMYGIPSNAKILDCACGIGTQLIGLSQKGYKMFGCDNSINSLNVLAKELKERNLLCNIKHGDFRFLTKLFHDFYDAIVCIDNALPHLIDENDFFSTCKQIYNLLENKGICILSFRDYDEILKLNHLLLLIHTFLIINLEKEYIFKNGYGKEIQTFMKWNFLS